MPNFYSSTRPPQEPRNRFYPTQDARTPGEPPIPSAPTPPAKSQMTQPTMPQQPAMPELQTQPPVNPPMQFPPQMPERRRTTPQRQGNATYFEKRHPMMLRRLYAAADTMLDTYPNREFIYDAYPDYLSLRLMRDRILRENRALTEEFLQEGCPIAWLELLTDVVLSELLCRKRHSASRISTDAPNAVPYRSPMGDANTTSV